MKIGSQSESDNKFTSRYRHKQSEYREYVLMLPPGHGPNKNSTTEYGNMLTDGESSGANFISKNAFHFAKQKVLDKQVNKEMTIDDYRLFNNMLSSMPMCFNLFSDLRQILLTDPETVSKVISQMFKEIIWINKVTYLDVEFIPVPISDYTNDKSAFDAMILVEDKDGKKGLISIETKYTDLLGSNSSSNVELKDQLIKNNKIFKANLVNQLMVNGYQQIHRNYLLTYAYAKKNKYKHFANVVISPKEDCLSQKEIELLQSELLQEKDTIMKIPLETLVERGISCNVDGVSNILQKFKERYFI